MELVKQNRVWLLVVILSSYFVVGFPDGAFTVSWLGIADEIQGMTTAHTGYILVGYSVTYTLAGVLLSRLGRFMKLQTIYLWGLIIMGAGFISLALSPNFAFVLATITVYGFGTGLMASSMNSYMAKHFTARHNNWMHCFWGAGASLSPVIMGQMMAVLSWRAGYFAITGILLAIGIVLLISMYKKVWINDDDALLSETAAATESGNTKRVLAKKWHQVVEILTFFFLGGTDYTLVFFTGAALIARGHQTEYSVAIFSAVYYVSMTAGRMFFGWAAKWLKEVPIVRIGVVIAIAGIAVLYFTSNVAGMALAGFGLGPMLPTLVSDSSNRFSPRVLSKIVGYELAAFGAGIAVLFFITSQIMHFISYEALFPLALAFVLLVFVCNEVLVVALGRANNKAS